MKLLLERIKVLLVIPLFIILYLFMSNVTETVRLLQQESELPNTAATHTPTKKEIEQARQDDLKRKADASVPGQALIAQKYTGARTVVVAPKLLAVLNKHAGRAENAQGFFVQYTKNPSNQLPDGPFDNDPPNQAAPDVIVDATPGSTFMVALSKNYADGRGLTCFTHGDPRDMSDSTFNGISADLWHQSLDREYTHQDLAKIPRDFTCYTQEG